MLRNLDVLLCGGKKGNVTMKRYDWRGKKRKGGRHTSRGWGGGWGKRWRSTSARGLWNGKLASELAFTFCSGPRHIRIRNPCVGIAVSVLLCVFLLQFIFCLLLCLLCLPCSACFHLLPPASACFRPASFLFLFIGS